MIRQTGVSYDQESLPLSVYVTYICVLYGICVLIFYFHCHFSTVHVRLIRVY